MKLAIATNNGDIGGGEVMLLNIAKAARSLGHDVLVVAPRGPGELARKAADEGFAVEVLEADGRLQYMVKLFLWRLRNRKMLLWCNGLVPSAATAGLGRRITELHILPVGKNRFAAKIAKLGRPTLVVPSRFMGTRIEGSRVLENWCDPVEVPEKVHGQESIPEPVRVGFLGRLVCEKGPHVLADAVRTLNHSGNNIRLVIAGEQRFGSAEDEARIEASLAPLGDAVEYTGWTEREEFFASVDFAVFPSVFEEPFGLVAAEAMSAGVPFVISNIGGLPEVAGPGYPWVAEANDPDSLARTLKALIEADPELVREWVERSRSRWQENFSPEAGRERVKQLLGELG